MTTEPIADPAHAFLEQLPRFLAHAAFAFRHVVCPDTRADLAAETVALAWKLFITLAQRGKNPESFVTTLALRCSQAVRAGRRLARSISVRDALSPIAGTLDGSVTRSRVRHRLTGSVAEALADNTRSRIPDQVVFRIDFPVWRDRFGRRDRQVLDALAAGGRTSEVARQFRISQGRVSQLRRVFESNWQAFHSGHQ